MPFYTFRQNNSGGHFDILPDLGISISVIIEADDAHHANYRAERIGLYFDGAGDCECCGDRWYAMDRRDQGDPVPSAYGKPIAEPGDKYDGSSWVAKGEADTYVHYLDGRVVGYHGTEVVMVSGDDLDDQVREAVDSIKRVGDGRAD